MRGGWRRAGAAAALLAAVTVAALLVPARGAHPTITRAAAPAAADPNVRADVTDCFLGLLCPPTSTPSTPVPTPPTIPIVPPTTMTLPPTATPVPVAPPSTAPATLPTATAAAPTDTNATPAAPLGPFLTQTSSTGSSSQAAGDTLNTDAPTAAATSPNDAFGASGLVTAVITVLALTAVGAAILFWRLR